MVILLREMLRALVRLQTRRKEEVPPRLSSDRQVPTPAMPFEGRTAKQGTLATVLRDELPQRRNTLTHLRRQRPFYQEGLLAEEGTPQESKRGKPGRPWWPD